MRALILNSGLGSRLGKLTEKKPKCCMDLGKETILERQLRLLYDAGIMDLVITTGPFEKSIKDSVADAPYQFHCSFVHNPDYEKTNYIYSIYLARNYLDDDIVLMHGDLVFSPRALAKILATPTSSVIVNSGQLLPKKDFKAVLNNNRVDKIGIDFFDDAVACQPLYKLLREDWLVWLDKIIAFCQTGNSGVYAEQALNQITRRINLLPCDIDGEFCGEIDTYEDLVDMRMTLTGGD